jgi:hypothetical protein
MIGNAFSEDRIADGHSVIIAIPVEIFIPRPARAYMVENNIVAVLNGNRIFRAPASARPVCSNPDVAYDNVVRILDEQRSTTLLAARMGQRNSAAWRSLACDRQKRIADDRPHSFEPDCSGHTEYADPRPAFFDTGAQRAGACIRRRGHLDYATIASSTATCAMTDGSGEG